MEQPWEASNVSLSIRICNTVRAASKSAALAGADQLDTAGQTILQLLNKAATSPSRTVDTQSTWLRSSRISFAPRTSGFQN